MTIEELFVKKYKTLEESNEILTNRIENLRRRICQYEECIRLFQNFDIDIKSKTKVFISGHFLNEKEIEIFQKFGIINFENLENKENKNE